MENTKYWETSALELNAFFCAIGLVWLEYTREISCAHETVLNEGNLGLKV